MRVKAWADLRIHKFDGATITELESGMFNGIIDIRDEIPYLTQRPAIDVFSDASADITDGRGRGIYYWQDEPALYLMHDGTLYKDSYGSVLSASPTAGTKKCFFFEVGTLLVMLDPENDQGFTIDTSDVVTEITDTDFPPKQAPAVGLAYGGASLDTYLFVLGENGIIYHCASADASTWGALDFIEASREPDGGVYLGKHHDNIVAMGPATTEFFYNAGNAVGSVLNRRQDLSYNIGCSSGESVWEEGDVMFWVGPSHPGSLGVYKLEKFGIAKISNSTIDSFLTQAIERNGYSVAGSGLSGKGRVYYVITLYTTPANNDPVLTLVFDALTGLWSEWETTVNSLTKFPLIGWTRRGGDSERFGEGILMNGDLISVNDNLLPNDTLLGAVYVEDGYVADDYVGGSADTGTAITLRSRLGMWDAGTNKHKYPVDIRTVGDFTEASQTLTIKWADENNNSFNTGRSLDISKYQKAHRLGRFRRRNYEIETSADEQVRIEGLETNLTVGDN